MVQVHHLGDPKIRIVKIPDKKMVQKKTDGIKEDK